MTRDGHRARRRRSRDRSGWIALAVLLMTAAMALATFALAS